MAEFNKNNREEFDESIDFMMKRRKEPAKPASDGRAVNGSTGEGNLRRQDPSATAPKSASNGVQMPRNTAQTGMKESQNRAPSARTDAQGINRTAGAPRAAATNAAPSQRPATPAGATRPAANARPSAPGAPKGTTVSAASGMKNTNSVQGVKPQDQTAAAAQTAKSEFVTSGQRIVPAGRPEGAPSGAKRPINIKRTSDVVDSQATRKTDISEKVQAGKGKAKKKRKDDKTETAGTSVRPVAYLVFTVIYLVFVMVIASVLSVFVINVSNDVFAFVKSDELVEVTISENATTADVAEELYQNGVIKYKAVFEMYGKIKEIKEDYVPGVYTVTPMMNYDTLFKEFKPKPVSGTSRITIPEGYTVDEIIDLMLSYGIGGTREDYVKAINEGEFDYWFVEELETNGWSENRFYRLEGYLFPDTYEFYNASDAYTVVNKMLRRFSEIYNEKYKARADELGMTTDQVVTLASMIEKEAGISSDFRTVSSVFHNRLNNPGNFPRLESDATVVYAIHHLTGERPTDVTGETISFVSPYNTYQNNGLPPGAIANPGMNALKYAIYPAETNYYFFVSAKNGNTYFATTAAGHEANKQTVKNENENQ